MFREMRRKERKLPVEECIKILQQGTSGVLALLGDNEYPYAVPISYVYDDGKLYFHSAREGHKLDAIRHNSKASFCVIGQDNVIPEKYTTNFKSVIIFGSVRIIEDESEKRAAIEKLALRYAPEDNAAHRQSEINRVWNILCMIEMTIEHMTGKGN